MDHRGGLRRLPEHRAQRIEVDQVDLVEGEGAPAQGLDPAQGLPARVGQVVDDRDLVAAVQQFQAGVTADITGAAGDENMHGTPPCGRRGAGWVNINLIDGKVKF